MLGEKEVICVSVMGAGAVSSSRLGLETPGEGASPEFMSEGSLALLNTSEWFRDSFCPFSFFKKNIFAAKSAGNPACLL